jgi:erythromycin esterase
VTTNPSTAPVRLSAEAVIPLGTADPVGPLDDLEWLDQAIGDSRVVAIGESAHYNREFFQLRHRLLRYLVERHGFSAYAVESGFVEGCRVDPAQGAPDRPCRPQRPYPTLARDQSRHACDDPDGHAPC